MREKTPFRLFARVARIIVGAGALISLLAFAYCVYEYALSGGRQFTSPIGPVTYFGLPAVVGTLLLLSLRSTARSQIFVAAICVSLIACGYGLELYLRISDIRLLHPTKPVLTIVFESHNKERMAAKLSSQYGVAIDTRELSEVIADFQKKDVDAVPQFILPLLEKDSDNRSKSAIVIDGMEVMPLGGIGNTLTVVCNQNGQYFTYKTDEHGFNNPGAIWRSGKLQIAVLGNSLTLGACVPADRSFVSTIRRRYPHTLNLGMPGEGPLQILAALKEYVLPFQPRQVLWFYPEANSFSELRAEKESAVLMRYLEDGFGQALRAKQFQIDHALKKNIARLTILARNRQPKSAGGTRPDAGDLRQFAKLGGLRQKLGAVYGKTRLSSDELDGLQPDLRLFGEILSLANERVTAWGGKLYFVYLPSWGRYANQGDAVGVVARNHILAAVNSRRIPLIDTHLAFQRLGDPLSAFPFGGPGHFNEEGHRLIAEAVIKHLSSEQTLDEQSEVVGLSRSGMSPTLQIY